MRSAASAVQALTLALVPLALGLGLAWRVTAAPRIVSTDATPAPRSAPAARVPRPAPLDAGALPMPRCWTCEDGRASPELDLDLLAPLGDGAGNAATWLAAFSRTGARAAEAMEARARRVPATLGGRPALILSAGDALLAEAEAWADQGTCRFYPDVWVPDAEGLRRPNLLLALTFAKSWVARGEASPDAAAGIEDARRAIRLGRLMLQDDVSVEQDLVGRACIRIGVEALHRRARRDGDLPAALATALALADVDGRRYEAARHAAVLGSVAPGEPGVLGAEHVIVTEADLGALVDLARGGAERRWRIGALAPLRRVAGGGTDAQRAVASSALDALQADADRLVADAARFLADARAGGGR